MATTARQQYFADESSLQKDSREFSIANDIQQKIDSVETWAQVNVIETVKVNGTALTPDSNKAVDIDVPDVIDNLYTVDSDNALSAKQWKILYDYIQNLQSVGRFLSNWDCATWLPTTNPSENPYVYRAWDYYMVSNVAISPATNYKPNGSSYTSWVASVTVETNNVSVSDRYIYDGTNWLLLSNSWSSITIDSSLSTTSTNPVENRVITNTLNSKQDALTAWDNISISNNTISADVNVKSFYLTWETWQTNLDTAQEAYEWQDAWNEAIIIYGPDRWIAWLSASWNTWEYRYLYDSWSWLVFVATTPVEQSSSQWVGGRSLNKALLTLTVSGWQVTAITKANSVVVADFLSTSQTNHPFSPTNNYDPATKKYVDDSISGITIPTVNDATISFTQNGASVWDITLNQSSAETIALIDTTYTAGTWISIGDWQDYSAMRWPCPEGYHIPQSSEWTAIKNIWIALWWWSTAWTNFSIALKLPFAWGRNMYYASNEDVGSKWKYWSCDTNQNVSANASTLLLSSSQINSPWEYAKWAWYSIRWKKDVPVIPTNSWTKLYWTSIAAGWIFWSSTDWLISLSSDWNTWITIADKNLWATQVWNDWDTLSSANSWYYYQWWNNYWFPWMDTDYTTITRSTTKVDASTYWPWNYYSSDTWIRVTSWSREEPNNTNLWWWVTWVVTLHNVITNTGVTSVNWQTWDITIQTGWNYSAGTWINISNQNVISADTTVVATQTDLASKQGTLTASTWINIDSSNNISNTLPWPTIAAAAPTGTEWALWYDTTNDVLMAHDWTAWKEAWTQMKVLSYGHSTWQDFIDAYNENAIVYCRASSQSNPWTWNQTRMAFMAYVNSATPTEVEFQYYRSRSDHNTAANQLDQVFVYKLTSASWWTWTVTERNTWAKAVAWTWINLTFGSGNMTIANDWVTSVNGNTWAVTVNEPIVSSSTPATPTEWMIWYDTTNDVLKAYDGTNWNVVWDDSADVNTKTFYLSWYSWAANLAEAQAAYDWYIAGKNPIIVYTWLWIGWVAFIPSFASAWVLMFASNVYSTIWNNDWTSTDVCTTIWFAINSWNVVSIQVSNWYVSNNYLATNQNYPTPYTPLYNWSPATKKYVDDNALTAVNWWVKVFTFPSANDDITSLVTWLTSWWDAILKDSNSYCRVTMYDSANKEIRAIEEAGSSRDEWVIEYDSSNIVTSILATERKYLAPDNAWSIGDVLTKKVGGYEWAAPSGWIWISSQSDNILTSWATIWAGTQSDYENLGTYDNNTIYITI